MDTFDPSGTRHQLLKKAQRVVIKVGTSVIARNNKEKKLTCGLCQKSVERLADEVKRLIGKEYQIILVTSGAVMAGRSRLKFGHQHLSIPEKQACAAIGQSYLIKAYEKAFGRHGIQIAQILLGHHDLGSRKRYLNAKNTLDTLLAHHVVPIINENDTVSVDEIKIGDNDTLSADVACLIGADLLVILSDVEGLYTSDPLKSSRSGKKPKLISLVSQVTPQLEYIAGKSKNKLAVGGMMTKVRAAKRTMSFGIGTMIVSGLNMGNLRALFKGDTIGTLFWSGKTKIKNRKYWIAHTLKPAGGIIIDKGARKAILEQGRSLLSAGIIQVEGRFDFGNSVQIFDEDRCELARGLVNYSSEDLDRIKGMKTTAVRKLLVSGFYEEVIHRNDLVVW